MAEGKAEGEKAKALETAKNLLSEGLDESMVSRCTGLSLSEIEKLSKI
jgi:predicted transposase YdaD